jgi:hypothetical protein
MGNKKGVDWVVYSTCFVFLMANGWFLDVEPLLQSWLGLSLIYLLITYSTCSQKILADYFQEFSKNNMRKNHEHLHSSICLYFFYISCSNLTMIKSSWKTLFMQNMWDDII